MDARSPGDVSTRRYTHPAVFGIIELPFGAAVGFLQIAVPYWLARQGLPLAQIAQLSAVAFLPHAWKVTWVPLLDFGVSRRAWYLLATLFTAAMLAAVALLSDPQHQLALYTALITAAQVGAATSSAAVEALMALTAAPDRKSQAGGFKMAGNVGGIGLLGALPIWLASHYSMQVAGLVVAGIVLVSGAAAFLVAAEPARDASMTGPVFGVSAIATRFAAIFRDVASTVRSREGWTTLVFCVAPVGAGALVNLASAIAPAYGASEQIVEMVDGIVGGLIAAAGAILGGLLADRMNRRLAYCLFAGLTAVAALAMAAAPMTPTTYVIGTLAYRFANGITMAAFAGMILQLVAGGRAVATTFTLFVALTNQSISFVTYLDGQASQWRGFGARATVAFDGVLTLAGIVAVGLMVVLLRRLDARRP